jgi:hypothetical protein
VGVWCNGRERCGGIKADNSLLQSKTRQGKTKRAEGGVRGIQTLRYGK